jgi:lambda repressor-like predicted transcriptional regulator
MVSETFRAKLKLAETPAYKLAIRAGVSPHVLSKLTLGLTRAEPGDERVIAVGRLLGLPPEECFAPQGGNDA